MSANSKRKLTVSLLSVAGGVVVLALVLAGPGKASHINNHKPPTKLAKKKVVPTKKVAPMEIPPAPPKVVEKKVTPKVDVVFALDTTGSMSGLLNGAKRKIWSIANQILSGDPQPHVRLGLIAYRDKGDAYVTKRFALTENVEDIYAHLKRLRANGGGDTPEHVNRALRDAIVKMQWREGQGVLRQVYLVGDAPPHEGRDGLYSRKLAQLAANKGIAINAVRCGRMSSTAASWRKIALASGGTYASIRQDGGMLAIKTPYDREMAKLNSELTATLLPSGGGGAKAAARRRARINADMDALAQAESAKYRARTGRLDSNDLLSKMEGGKALGSFADEELPAAVAALPKDARGGYVKKIKAKRARLKQRIAELSKKRDSYLRAKKPASSKGFDDTIKRSLKEQGSRAGLAY